MRTPTLAAALLLLAAAQAPAQGQAQAPAQGQAQAPAPDPAPSASTPATLAPAPPPPALPAQALAPQPATPQPATPQPVAADEPGLQRYRIGDLPLEGGGVIHDFSIAYMTEGTLNAAKSNAVLMVTAIGGNHHRIDYLIGPGRGLDTDHLFVVKTDAIGNGLTTSPSTSTTQHGPDFPHFTIRDMVESQARLLDHLGIGHLVAVAGASMGGMQALQWGVSHPAMMDALVALTPMARTSPWSIAINEATRHGFALDAGFQGGRYTRQPEAGWRMRADILQVLASRTPEAMRTQFADPDDVIPWIAAQEATVLKARPDANDWIAQTWAYDRHNVGDTPVDGRPVYAGDPVRALHAIKAKALLMSGELDLYNPVEEGIAAAAAIPDGRHVTIPSIQGHVAASPGYKPADLEFINATVAALIADVTRHWRTLE